MTEKPYTTATRSMETETCRHCIYIHTPNEAATEYDVLYVNNVREKVRHMPVLYGLQQHLQNNNNVY